jgi:hypothetical protein
MSDLQQYLIESATRFGEHKGKQGSEFADRDVRFTGNAGRLSGCFQNIIEFCC